MKPLSLILLVILIVVVIYKVSMDAPPPGQIPDDDPSVPTSVGTVGNQLLLSERLLDGEEPDVAPILVVQVEIPDTVGGTTLYLNITEEHGYYVESFFVHVYKKETPGQFVEFFLNLFLEANGTLRVEQNIVPAEMASKFGGSMGTSEDWAARVARYNRARVESPNPLPDLVENP